MSAPFPLPRMLIEAAVARALAEDLGDAGDITTLACIGEDARARATLSARKSGVIAGAEVAEAAFRLVDPSIRVETLQRDGARVGPGAAIMSVEGAARGMLVAERTALNFLARMSGVATATAALVDAIAGTRARIACTRKTTPLLRAFEKHAVRCGGGVNHRFGLYDAAMIKDNHIVAAGGIAPALAAVRARVGHLVKIEVEIDRLDQLEAAIAGGADVVMLDNMSLADMTEAVRRAAGRATLEASGNVTLESVRAIAETGVDIISSGAVTHSAPALDLGLDFH